MNMRWQKMTALLLSASLFAMLAAPVFAENGATPVPAGRATSESAALAEEKPTAQERSTGHSFTLYFDSNGGRTLDYYPNPLSITQTAVDQYNLPFVVSFGFTAQEGYTFIGWNTKSDGTGALYYPGHDYYYNAYDGDYVVLYAIWQQEMVRDYRIQLDANGGIGSKTLIRPRSERYTSLVGQEKGFYKAGYKMDGWCGWPEQETAVYSLTDSIDMGDDPRSITIYAHWVPTTEPQPTPAPTVKPTPRPSAAPTGIKGFVTRLYKVCLEREPNASELQGWAKQLTGGEKSGTEVAYGFVFGTEFQSKNYCNSHYATMLYKAFMDRRPDATGLNGWTDSMGKGMTREEVFNGFAQSTEFADICKSYGVTQGKGIDVPAAGQGTVPHGACALDGKKDGVTTFVERLYKVCLGRDADATGLKDWTAQLWAHTASGATVAHGFIFSDEFQSKNYSNAEYVCQLYRAFMGREADTPGLADWAGRLDAGQSRQTVFEGFAGSDEFTALCNAAGIVRG